MVPKSASLLGLNDSGDGWRMCVHLPMRMCASDVGRRKDEVAASVRVASSPLPLPPIRRSSSSLPLLIFSPFPVCPSAPPFAPYDSIAPLHCLSRTHTVPTPVLTLRVPHRPTPFPTRTSIPGPRPRRYHNMRSFITNVALLSAISARLLPTGLAMPFAPPFWNDTTM